MRRCQTHFKAAAGIVLFGEARAIMEAWLCAIQNTEKLHVANVSNILFASADAIFLQQPVCPTTSARVKIQSKILGISGAIFAEEKSRCSNSYSREL